MHSDSGGTALLQCCAAEAKTAGTMARSKPWWLVTSWVVQLTLATRTTARLQVCHPGRVCEQVSWQTDNRNATVAATKHPPSVTSHVAAHGPLFSRAPSLQFIGKPILGATRLLNLGPNARPGASRRSTRRSRLCSYLVLVSANANDILQAQRRSLLLEGAFI